MVLAKDCYKSCRFQAIGRRETALSGSLSERAVVYSGGLSPETVDNTSVLHLVP
jgi:hypothetical protein